MPRGQDDTTKTVDRLMRLAAALGLPEVELSTSFDDPALKLRGKAMAVVKAPDLLYLPCPLDQKEVLLEMAPEIYFETDHYKGWPGLLVRLEAIGDDELGRRIEDAWRYRAPRRPAQARAEARRGR